MGNILIYLLRWCCDGKTTLNGCLSGITDYN